MIPIQDGDARWVVEGDSAVVSRECGLEGELGARQVSEVSGGVLVDPVVGGCDRHSDAHACGLSGWSGLGPVCGRATHSTSEQTQTGRSGELRGRTVAANRVDPPCAAVTLMVAGFNAVDRLSEW